MTEFGLYNRPYCEPPKGNIITKKEQIAPQIKLIEVYVPEIAQKAKAGQFVILRLDEEGERIPLTLVEWNKVRGTITLIFQEIGATTKKLGNMRTKDEILNIAGPLGNPSEIENYGLTFVVCGGVGTAAAYPIAKALKKAGNKVIAIIGARNEEMLILEEEMKRVTDKVYITTDDGSKGHKGFVTDVLKKLLEKGNLPNLIYAIGPPVMMRAASGVTKGFGVKTIVSLNPIMIDGMGMCGACRVTVGDQTKFACIDGPEFDASIVNFEELVKRLKAYSEEEKFSTKFCEGGIGTW
ncbi:MAG: sulfide/dihydroorotate dehydrogenase-like FAD/NAD-binding protein [Candidatus Bathyarchaeota archaeon]|nr:sulfide/dihydroorotate dehydrogenase-like FAD/NAD-binding protein [Candidatus Bathyarchaeota archaeon]